MIAFRLNGRTRRMTVIGRFAPFYLRNDRRLTAAKDGCSGQAACGACLVELNGKACSPAPPP